MEQRTQTGTEQIGFSAEENIDENTAFTSTEASAREALDTIGARLDGELSKATESESLEQDPSNISHNPGTRRLGRIATVVNRYERPVGRVAHDDQRPLTVRSQTTRMVNPRGSLAQTRVMPPLPLQEQDRR